MRAVAKEFEYLVNQLHPSADARADFEKLLQSEILEKCDEVTAKAFSCHFDENEPIPYTKETEMNSTGTDFSASRVLDDLNYDPNGDLEEFRSKILRYRSLHVQ